MKIIAKTGNSDFLIAASEAEIKAVLGHDRYAKDSETGSIEIGREFDVCESYQQLVSLRGARKQLDGAAKTLRDAADHIDAVKTPPVAQFETKRTR